MCQSHPIVVLVCQLLIKYTVLSRHSMNAMALVERRTVSRNTSEPKRRVPRKENKSLGSSSSLLTSRHFARSPLTRALNLQSVPNTPQITSRNPNSLLKSLKNRTSPAIARLLRRIIRRLVSFSSFVFSVSTLNRCLFRL